MGSANVEGNNEGMKEDREYEAGIRKCASVDIQGVSGLSKIDNNFPCKNVKCSNYIVGEADEREEFFVKLKKKNNV